MFARQLKVEYKVHQWPDRIDVNIKGELPLNYSFIQPLTDYLYQQLEQYRKDHRPLHFNFMCEMVANVARIYSKKEMEELSKNESDMEVST